jgi:tetratricopeptide (TPR) repeat protein
MKQIFVAIATILCFTACNNTPNKTIDIKKDATLAQLDSLIKANPNSAEAYYRRAIHHLAKMHLGESTNDINKAIELDSNNANYYVTVADLHLLTNNSGRCKAALDKCLSVDSNNIQALLKMSELYLYVKENAKAISYANRVIDKEKTNAKAYFLIGMNQKELQDTTRALLAFQEAINNNQEYYNAYIQLGLIYAEKNNNKAVMYYTNASNIDAKNPEPYFNKGVYYQKQGNLKKAIESYNQALQLMPTYKGALYNLGLAIIDAEKNYTKAASYFERNMLAQPNFALGFYMHGVCQLELGNTKLAISDFEKTLQLEPENKKAKSALQKLQKN